MKNCEGVQRSIDGCSSKPEVMIGGCPDCMENANQDLVANGLVDEYFHRKAYFLGAKAQRNNVDMPWHENVVKGMQAKPSPQPIVPVGVRIAARKLAERVAPVYRLLGWWWVSLGRPSRVPTEEEIFNKLIHLYEELQTRPNGIKVSVGGLACSRSTEEGESIYEFGFRMSEIVT